MSDDAYDPKADKKLTAKIARYWSQRGFSVAIDRVRDMTVSPLGEHGGLPPTYPSDGSLSVRVKR